MQRNPVQQIGSRDLRMGVVVIVFGLMIGFARMLNVDFLNVVPRRRSSIPGRGEAFARLAGESVDQPVAVPVGRSVAEFDDRRRRPL
jgi:hypothetical protein